MRLVCMMNIAPPAPMQPVHRFGPPALPPPVLPVAAAPRRRRALPIALGAIAVLGISGTIAGFAGKASSDSRAAELSRSNRNLNADLDDADADILGLERQVAEADIRVVELEGELDDSAAEVLSLRADLLDAQVELQWVHEQLETVQQGDAPSAGPGGGAPSLNDGLVSPFEADILSEQMRGIGFVRATLDVTGYQEIADRACAVVSIAGLEGVVDWAHTSHPAVGSLDAAAFMVGAAAGVACETHIWEILGI